MIVLCPICRTRLPVDDDKVREGVKVQCTLCDEVFVADPSMAEQERSTSRSISTSVPRAALSVPAAPELDDEEIAADDVPCILVAHDSHSFCERSRQLLEEEGYEVAVVYDGAAADERVHRRPFPAVAVLDASLPGKLGTVLTEDLKKENSAVRVVLVASVYERYRIRREVSQALTPDGFVDPRNVARELLPCVRRLTGIGAGALQPRRRAGDGAPAARAVPAEPAVDEESRPSSSESIADLEAELEGLLDDESSVPPPDFDDEEDRKIWERILAEEGESSLESSEASSELDLGDPDSEASLASARAFRVEDEDDEDSPESGKESAQFLADDEDESSGTFDPGQFLTDDEDDDAPAEDAFSLDDLDDDEDEVSVDSDDEDELLGDFPLLDGGAGENSMELRLDTEPQPEPQPSESQAPADVLRIDEIDEPQASGPTETPATIAEDRAFGDEDEVESSVSRELQIPVIADDVELSAPRANAVVATPEPRETDEDDLIASLDETFRDTDGGSVPPSERTTASRGEQPDLFDTSELPPNMQEAHQKAQRLARIIVSDIVLYNQDRIAEAIRNDTFFEELKGDIKDGREFFEEKVPPEVRRQCDYLQRMLENLVDEKRKELGL